MLAFSASTAVSLSAQMVACGPVAASDVTMTRYEKDTAAVTVVLSEFGEALIINGYKHKGIFDVGQEGCLLADRVPGLKELFERILQIRNADLIFRRIK